MDIGTARRSILEREGSRSHEKSSVMILNDINTQNTFAAVTRDSRFHARLATTHRRGTMSKVVVNHTQRIIFGTGEIKHCTMICYAAVYQNHHQIGDSQREVAVCERITGH